jgi:SOS-response transcriptional repressor LexA
MGFPTFVEEENDLISLENYLTDNINASFMIKIKNDYLISIGILKGDLAVIERKQYVAGGDIVLVMMSNHHSFLRAEVQNGRTTLKSFLSNSSPTDSVQIIGIIKGIIRKY